MSEMALQSRHELRDYRVDGEAVAAEILRKVRIIRLAHRHLQTLEQSSAASRRPRYRGRRFRREPDPAPAAAYESTLTA
jgi:hypothetical protein